MKLAEELALTCYLMYANTASHLAPESVTFTPGHPTQDFTVATPNSVLRPGITRIFFFWNKTPYEAVTPSMSLFLETENDSIALFRSD